MNFIKTIKNFYYKKMLKKTASTLVEITDRLNRLDSTNNPEFKELLDEKEAVNYMRGYYLDKIDALNNKKKRIK